MPHLDKQYPETSNIKESNNPFEYENLMDILKEAYVDKGIEVIEYPVVEESVVEEVQDDHVSEPVEEQPVEPAT